MSNLIMNRAKELVATYDLQGWEAFLITKIKRNYKYYADGGNVLQLYIHQFPKFLRCDEFTDFIRMMDRELKIVYDSIFKK